jgi:hypothetical protein
MELEVLLGAVKVHPTSSDKIIRSKASREITLPVAIVFDRTHFNVQQKVNACCVR